MQRRECLKKQSRNFFLSCWETGNRILKAEITGLKNSSNGTYHVTDLGEITWWDFTNEIKKQGIEAGWINETGKNCVVNPCTTDEYPTPAKRPAYSVLSKDKIQKTLGIKLPDWKESLSKFLNSDLFDRSRLL